ncbi:Pycsar system effector family protein [Bradyrhizobium elkanii]|uniref:Pycsar system effector family protein n=1 Tax=Bradyrhizobium elkanii TaxID=29448 RepID=UPI00216997DA|nr:Pycsar system effector family protein [Bradyrhizobium elkanii]MCS3519265.1 hypothetical protein [Bradyrhizobium elkanii]MCS4066923.1 hypothetical protein [Bradyrhizobium elkanii]MCS4082458.1 hypothetical protein [Bradyrhizobium elkanii]MCW2127925.1 hypothetical protein [Bradyrhizobium elkanii]MCW2174668.1 hypothetical protein [Bradyrhizobium elkanii]
MGELLNIWREINASNRFAETKLTFFVGILVGILGFLNSGSALLAHEGRVLGGGDTRIVNLAIIIALVVSVSAAFPQLATPSRWDWLIPTKLPIELYYFLDIANFESSEAWLQACQLKIADDELPRARSIAGQIHVIAKIAARKFALLRYASVFVIAAWMFSWAVPLYKYLIQ